MIRKHELWTTDDGRIVYRITDFHTGERTSLRDRSASEYILTLEELSREIAQELESWIIPYRLNGQPRITPELPEDFEFPRALIVPEEEPESLERSM